MNFRFQNKIVTGMLTVVPKNIVKFEDEMSNYNFPHEKSLKIKKVMGFDQKRVAPIGVTAADLCVYGVNYLFDNNQLSKSEIDALVFVSQTPDHIMPPTSNLIQARLDLGTDVFCLDINQGCAGFLVGLFESFMLLEQDSINCVVLLNADVLSTKVSKQDRNSNPIIGDAGAITVIRKGKSEVIHATLNMDGKGALALQIPAGGARIPINDSTSILAEDVFGNFRSENHLVMKGDEVFNFVQTQVPPMISNLLKTSGFNLDDIDFFMFHQPNRFMLAKLAEKLGIDKSKIPSNIVEIFGNSSGATIPLNVCFNLGAALLNNKFKLCLAGFGVGLTWSSCLIDIGNLSFCEVIDYE
jgi:3-oxoacyl-[acyl-carrier-protein] synthase-3